MPSVNGPMMALSFLFGLILTSALMIRRVSREVPVSRPAAGLPEAKFDTPGEVTGT